MHNKKAVSGLIVAVLLLAISLTIGGLVIGWISGYTGDSLDSATQAQKQQDACADLDWKIVTVRAQNGTAQSARCHRFNVTIENKNTADIKGFKFQFVPSSGDNLITIVNNSATDAVGDYARKTYYMHHDDEGADGGTDCADQLDAGQTSGFTRVEVTPIVDVIIDTTVETVCTSKTKTVEKANYAT